MASQVAARVNSEDISVHQVRAMLQQQPRLIATFADQAPKQALQSLVEQELAAQAARKAGLENDPQVLQSLALVKREVLARAFQDRTAQGVTAPSSDEIDRYYDSHPELFAQRQRFHLQEVQVRRRVDADSETARAIANTTSAADVESLLRTRDLPYSARQTILMAEDLPLQLVVKVAALPTGRSMLVPAKDGSLIVTVIAREATPIDRQAATEGIRGFLLNERRRSAINEAMKKLRRDAQIDLLGNFAPGASAAAAPVSPASSASRFLRP